MSAKKIGRKSKQRQSLILGGIFVFLVGYIVPRIVYLDPNAPGKYQMVGQDHDHLAVKMGNDFLEVQRLENIKVLRVMTDVERTQTMALAQFAHKTCESMGLDIFADAGTLLGSMRHHDFIPWDDDMDFIVVLDNWSQVMEIHEVFEKRMKERPHPQFGTIGKTAPNLSPHCWRQKTCNVTEELPHGRPFLGMFRTHFMNSRTVGWRYNYNCTKEDDTWCSRWPSVDIFMFLKTNELLQNIIQWGGGHAQFKDVYPLRDMLFHGVLFKAPHNTGNFLARRGYPKTGWEFGDCHGGGDHRGGFMVHFNTNCTLLWDRVPFVRYRKQTKNNETIEVAYLNETIVSVLKLDEKGRSTCYATIESTGTNGCGAEYGL